MATSSEDVLLVVSSVRHKKNDGTLYLMAERVAWIMNGKDSFSVSHRFSDIKMQKISPDGKSKIQLQVVLHDGGTSTFQFLNPEGQEKQIRDRDDVKEALQQLLPHFKRKINKDLEEKNRALADDPELCQLYKDLVTSQVLTADEFWADHIPKKETIKGVAQDVGVSGAFLADIKPQSDGCNGLKYNLTADIIEAIFKTYPAVKRKHLEHVPDKLTESEFWTRFFQSHYFHRDRMSTSAKDIFSECAKIDEQDIQREIGQTALDPLVDITTFMDYTLESVSQEPEMNNSHGQTQCTSVNRNMIRRFNHHSMMVLKACEVEQTSTDSTKIPDPIASKVISTETPGNFNGTKPHKHIIQSEAENETQAKKAKLQSKLIYEDLEVGNGPRLPALNLTHLDRYFHGPTPVASSEYMSNDELIQSIQNMQAETHSWHPKLTRLLQGNSAIIALGELSPGGAMMKRANLDNLQATVPHGVQVELKNLYKAACELLRHFWSCFPVTDENLENKLIRMQGNLERFHYAKLIPFQDTMIREHQNPNLVKHLQETMEAAFAKFSTWQARRILKK